MTLALAVVQAEMRGQRLPTWDHRAEQEGQQSTDSHRG